MIVKFLLLTAGWLLLVFVYVAIIIATVYGACFFEFAEETIILALILSAMVSFLCVATAIERRSLKIGVRLLIPATLFIGMNIVSTEFLALYSEHSLPVGIDRFFLLVAEGIICISSLLLVLKILKS